jgi:predicted ATPase
LPQQPRRDRRQARVAGDSETTCDRYILDEPEAALSPARQLSFLAIIRDIERSGHAQFIIASHSPIILSYPGATILSMDGDKILEINYKETDHYKLTRDFLECPERYFRHLFADSASDLEEE